MTDTPSSSGPQDFSHFGPLPDYLANRGLPDFPDLGKIIGGHRAKAPVSCAEIAKHFWGEPTSSKAKELRWGTHGSRAVNLKKNVWFDHEANEGGDTIKLVERELRCTRETAISWLVDIDNNVNLSRTTITNLGRQSPPLGRIVATYDYVDESGAMLSQVVRFEPKTFRQRRPNGNGGWSWSVKGVRPVPYRLPELVKDVSERRTILIVEGEKDVDNLRKQGFAATCNAGGAKKWRRELTPYLSGADVVLIPDNDAAGREHANDVGFALEKVAARVRIVDLSGLPEKGDVSDWFAAGHTADELSQLIAAAPKWEPRALLREPDTPAGPEPEASVQQANTASAGGAQNNDSDQARSGGEHQPDPHKGKAGGRPEELFPGIFGAAPHSAPDEAAEPQPLMRPLSDPEPFPLEALLDLASPTQAICNVVQSPIEMCAGAVLASTAFALSAHIDIRLPTGQIKPVSCWFWCTRPSCAP
jgi:hypothetical protein